MRKLSVPSYTNDMRPYVKLTTRSLRKDIFRMNILSTATSLCEAIGHKIIKIFKLRLILMILLAVLEPNFTMAKTFDFSDWDDLLKKYIDSNKIDGTRLNTVNYKKLQNDPVFPKLIDDLKSFFPSQLQTHKEKLAFWINVYNVFAVKIVTENYPLKSIKDIGGLFKPVWKHNAGVVGRREYTLDEIEHKILRKMGEPRVHVAIVCASISCPDLAKDAFRPETLNEQLDAQMRGFLANPGKGMRVDADGKKVFLSSIFDWFKEDFESRGGVFKFIQHYVAPKDKQALKNISRRIFYMEYNWRVNSSLPGQVIH